MQIVLDTLVETPAALRLTAKFLNDYAALRIADMILEEDARVDVEASDMIVPSHQHQPVPPAPASVDAEPDVMWNAQGETESPLAPEAPPAPIATATVTPIRPSNSVPASVPPTSQTSPSSSPTIDVYDITGVPWDARIHQKAKSTKKDGTWKLQKGIANSFVESVMRELSPRIRKAPTDPSPSAIFGRTPLPVGAIAPVPLPGPATHTAPAQEAPQAPPAPPSAEGPSIDPFRALVSKITKARAAEKLTAAEVTSCYTAAGLPSLQMLVSMPNKVPEVEASIDAILATR